MSFTTAAERPDLVDAMWGLESTWPEFMLEDPVANLLYPRLVEVFGAFQVIALDDSGTVIGRINSVPFVWTGADDDLPDRGWDEIIERAFRGYDRNERPNAVSLLEARLAPECQGSGLSIALIDAARRHIRGLGITDLFGPVRPTGKSLEPEVPLPEYVARVRADGLPQDPWLRVHVRAGGRVVRVCPASITVSGALDQWRGWTGLPFDRSGDLAVPGALTAVHVSLEHNHAVYVEPNVWVHHRL